MLIFAPTNADMAKLVDVPDLGSGAARRVGSSPIIRTKKASHYEKLFFLLYFNEFRFFLERYKNKKPEYCYSGFVVPPGIEPGTHGFSVHCSTI